MEDKNKGITSDYTIVGSETGSILFQKNSNGAYFKELQKSELVDGERKFNHILKTINDLKHKVGAEISVDVKNVFDQLDSEYEEKEYFYNTEFKNPIVDGFIDVNGEIISNYLILNRCKDAVFNSVILNGVVNYSGNIKLIVEYSSDKINWKEYESFDFGNPKPISRTKEFVVCYFSTGGGNDTGFVFDPDEYVFRNSENIVFTKTDIITASKYEWFGDIHYYNESGDYINTITFHEEPFILPKELTIKDNFKIQVPRKANWWGTNLYGYIKDPLHSGKDILRGTAKWYNRSFEGYEEPNVPLNYIFESDKRVSSETNTLFVRIKLKGQGTIKTEGRVNFLINSVGTSIIKEEYFQNIDEETDIYIERTDKETLYPTRDLFHKEASLRYNLEDKKNYKQTISINLVMNGGSKIKILQETYTSDFIHNLKVKSPKEKEFLLFESNDILSPTIVIPSKVKQLLYKKDGNYINKRIIDTDTSFTNFGYEIIEGIEKYNSDCEKLDNVISKDLNKINFFPEKQKKFSEILIGNKINTIIKDCNGKVISKGITTLSNDSDVDEKEICNLLKTKKTFYRLNIIIYSEYNEQIDDLITSLHAGKTTPQDLFLVCQNPNESNIELCHFNKTELGNEAFRNNAIKSVKNKHGLQFTSIEEIFNLIDVYINENIELEKNFSLNNAVGINIYDFTDALIDENFINRYGYFVNKVNKNFIKNENFKLFNTSENNSIEGVTQYDIGSMFSAEFDLSDVFKNASDDQISETIINDKSISIHHINNILYKFVVGEEEIKIFKNEPTDIKYSYSINSDKSKTILKLMSTFNFSSEHSGYNYVIVSIKDKNAIETSYIIKFLIDFKEPAITDFNIKTTNEIEETNYKGNKNKTYSKDTFITVGINLLDLYNFDESNYKLLIKNKKIPDYKIERDLIGKWKSKLLTFHLDDFKNEKEPEQKLKFGEWECSIIRNEHNHVLINKTFNIELDINDSLNCYAYPAVIDLEDIENDGLQQGKDIYIELGFVDSDYFKKIRDWIYFCKEVRFISNGENFTSKPENFTYRNEESLIYVTNHNKIDNLDDRTSLRWFISGISEDNSNKYLKPISNLAGDSKKSKEIIIEFLLWDNSIIRTTPVKIGKTGDVSEPIIFGSEEHYYKLLKTEAKIKGIPFSELTEEDKENVKQKTKTLGKSNYDKQQTINGNKIFVYYTDLIEIQLDFGNAEYFTITQANKTSEMIPIVKDGKIRYVIDSGAIDEENKGSISVKGYIKLADGLDISSNEKIINFIRKKRPSIVQTGDDYTKYIQYDIGDNNYYNLKTVIQSKIILENMNDNYSSKWINHITADLVDVDKRTVIAYGPKIQFYDGFIPQRFVFDIGLTKDDLSSIKDDDRLEIEQTKKYKELEKILNDKIFSTGKHEGQTFYLRFKSVELAKDYNNEDKEIKGEDSFYPIKFVEELKELVIIPATGIIVKEENYLENYYTYKNKVSFVLESNNAEYFMYRTDRSASFQKVFPKTIGYTKTVKIIVPTYDVGNHFLEVKQKAIGETESNVYGVIVEKINPVRQPKITGEYITDENPYWYINPLNNAIKFQYSIISDEKEHSSKIIEAMQYETKIEPEVYLENGYHIFKAKAYDKINNSGEYSYFITRKIGRPIPSKISGIDKTSEDSIEWSWESQYYDGVRNYEVEINGSEKNTIPASLDGYNEYVLRHFQGRELTDGSYEIRVWSINELGNKSYAYSNFLTYKGSKIKSLAYEFYKYRENYTNKLECKVITDDPSIKYFEYKISKNVDGKVVEFTGVLTTNNKTIPFITADGNKIELDNGQYYFSLRGVNNIGEKTEYITTPFYYKISLPSKPFVYYEKSVKTTNPVFFIKETGEEMIAAIEVRVGDKPYEKVRNNVWRPNYSLPLGINNVVFKITDYAGNIAEYSDFVEITSKGINQFQGDYVADMNNPILYFDFNLSQMSNFGHSNFRVQQDTLGIDTIITVKNVNNIEIPLSTSSEGTYPDGSYIFTIKLYDELTNGYDYIADFFTVILDSKKPLTPYFLNSGYDGIEYNKMYTKNRNPKWIWQSKDINNISEYIINLYVYDMEEGNYVPYGNKQFIDFSTKLVGQFQTPDELKDGTYKLTVNSVGINNLFSDPVSFFIVVKNSLPKPPCFDLNNIINKKYENKNKGISWIWKDVNKENDVIVKYKIKINDEEFSDEFSSTITHYEETRTLNDGPNKITVIGCDKAGNWSSSNETTAIQLGNNFLNHTKIIDTVIPERLTDKDIVVNILDSNSCEVLFKTDNKLEEYFLFELFTLNQHNEEVYFVKGNTLPVGTDNIYFYDKKVIPGISMGELNGTEGYCEIKMSSNGNDIEKSLFFDNLLTNNYYLRIYGVDYSGNISDELIKNIVIQDLTKLKPQFILPKNTYTNNSTIIFQWVLNEPNIDSWEYQLITPYNNSLADLTNYEKWKKINTNIFTLNNIPKIIAGNKADGEYTLYVRAIFKEKVTQEGTGLETNKRSDIGKITVHLDRELPKGINFTNKSYTTDNSVLRWTWEYTGKGDSASGVYVSFNPNLPLEEWEKIEYKTEYKSFKERTDGIYTLYAKTFDEAGNINETIFSNTITIDRVPPFKPIINGGSSIYTNTIPTIEWEHDTNYYKYVWTLLTLKEFKKFKEVYDKIIDIENYKLKNDDWGYLFLKNKDDINIENVHENLIQFKFKNNDPIKENYITINSSDNKHGISEEGEYVFILTGYDENNNWAEDFEYQYITYDITAPDMSKIKFTSPKYVITTDRRPEWIWTTSNEVTKCEYFLEKNGYNDGSNKGTIYKESSETQGSIISYKFKPEYNLTQGEYNLIVDCFDKSNNSVRISKSIIIDGDTTIFKDEYFDIILPGVNNRIRCKKNKYSDVYTIIDIDIDKNSVITYKELNDKSNGYTIFELGKTELKIDETYEFNITSYDLKSK